MTDKGFSLFEKCVARWVHLFPQEKECTSSSWGNSKMCISGTIANSYRMLTEKNKSGGIAKIEIWVEIDTAKR